MLTILGAPRGGPPPARGGPAPRGGPPPSRGGPGGGPPERGGPAERGGPRGGPALPRGGPAARGGGPAKPLGPVPSKKMKPFHWTKLRAGPVVANSFFAEVKRIFFVFFFQFTFYSCFFFKFIFFSWRE